MKDFQDLMLFNSGQKPSLKELAALTVLRAGLRPSEEDLPLGLHRYLMSEVSCHCGRRLMDSKRVVRGRTEARSMARTVHTSTDTPAAVVLECVVCHREKCLWRTNIASYIGWLQQVDENEAP